MIAITGANGQLGELVIKALLKNTRPDQIVAAVRNPDKANALKTLVYRYGKPIMTSRRPLPKHFRTSRSCS